MTRLEANVKQSRKLAAHAALAVAAAALIGVSAFAESRPANGTRAHREDGGAIRRERTVSRSGERRSHETRNGSSTRSESSVRSGSTIDVRGSRAPEPRVESRRNRRDDSQREGRRRETVQRDRTTRRSDERAERRSESARERNDRYRSSDSRRQSAASRNPQSTHRRDDVYRNGRSSRSQTTYRGGRKPYFAHGRVSRVSPYRNGYRVWVHGAPYPFFVPSAYYHRDRFRIGLVIALGGYYNDRGYYDYYDARSAGELFGIVESVDYRRNTFVVRNEATGSFVTVVTRDREADRLRAGDYVELYGGWTRSGLFEARDVDLVDYRY